MEDAVIWPMRELATGELLGGTVGRGSASAAGTWLNRRVLLHTDAFWLSLYINTVSTCPSPVIHCNSDAHCICLRPVATAPNTPCKQSFQHPRQDADCFARHSKGNRQNPERTPKYTSVSMAANEPEDVYCTVGPTQRSITRRPTLLT